jgi:hypothetical protein
MVEAIEKGDAMSKGSGNDSPPSVDQAEKPPTGPAPVQDPEVESDFKAGKRELLILGTMAALNVILALDATVLPPALPVGTFHCSLQGLRLN